MKKKSLVFLYTSLFFLSCTSTTDLQKSRNSRSCVYGQADSCLVGESCVYVNKGQSECRSSDSAPSVELLFPYPPAQEAICDQGVLTPEGNSHTWWNTAYAIDLQSTNKNQDTQVLAGVSGRVIVFNECKTTNDQCGAGFGNSVKILTEDGLLVHYAHLKTTYVTTGQYVKSGDVIGVEGMTGWTGENNRHLHLSVHFDWRNNKFDFWKQVGYLPLSVPFSLKLCQDKCSSTCKMSSVPVKNIACRRTHKNVSAVCSQ